MYLKSSKSDINYSIILLLILFLSFFSFKGCTKDSENPIIDDDQNSIFTKAPDPTKVITIETSGGGKLRVIGNNVLIKVDSEKVDSETIKSIIEETGGELVGQIPMLGIYQAEYPFSSASELEVMIDELNAYSEVELATYNAVAKNRNILHDKEYCNRDYDNHELNDNIKCNFEDIEYYSAVPIMGFVREHMTLNKVTVAVFDSRIETGLTKEFDDVTIVTSVNLNNNTNPPPQPYSHGTQVAGVIAADNKDGGVNGIASSLIKDKLELLSSVLDTPATVIQDIERIWNVGLHDGVQICNMSYGYGGEGVWVGDIRFFYEGAFNHLDNILFVVAAGNEYFKITEDNDCPAGIQLPNVITVAGTKYNNPQQACSWSSYGPLMDIAAPCENWPLVDPDHANKLMIDEGNSYGAPAVASLAAILKSINPNLSPAQLKQYILNYSYGTDQSVSGRRLVLTLPIEQVLIDMHAPDEILDKIDIDDYEGEGDLPGIVVCRICGRSVIEVSGEPIMRCEADSTNMGSFNEMGGVFSFFTEDQMVLVGFWDTYEILHSTLEIVEPVDEGIQHGVTVGYIDYTTFNCGYSLSGEFSIQNAYITQRNPLNGDPMVINAEGKMSGTMSMIRPPDINITYYPDFSGIINIPIVLMLGGSEEFYEYFENNCD